MPDGIKQFLLQHVEKVLFGLAAVIGVYYVFVAVKPFDTEVEGVGRLKEAHEMLQTARVAPIDETDEGKLILEQSQRFNRERLRALVFEETPDRRLSRHGGEPFNPIRGSVEIDSTPGARPPAVAGLTDIELTPGRRRITVAVSFPVQDQINKINRRRVRRPMSLWKIDVQRRERGSDIWTLLPNSLTQSEMINQVARAQAEGPRRPQQRGEPADGIRPLELDDGPQAPAPQRWQPPGMQEHFGAPFADQFADDPFEFEPDRPQIVRVQGTEVDVWRPGMQEQEIPRQELFRFVFEDISVESGKHYQYRAIVHVTNPYVPAGEEVEIIHSSWEDAALSDYASPKSDREYFFASGVIGDPNTGTEPRAIVRVKVFFPTYERIPKAAFDKIKERSAGMTEPRNLADGGDGLGILAKLPANWVELAELETDAEGTGFWYTHDFGKQGQRLQVGGIIGSELDGQEFVELFAHGQVYYAKGRMGRPTPPARDPDERIWKPNIMEMPVDFNTGAMVVDVIGMAPDEAETLRPQLTLLCMDTAGNLIRKPRDENIQLYPERPRPERAQPDDPRRPRRPDPQDPFDDPFGDPIGDPWAP